MTDPAYASILTTCSGAVLVCAVTVLWLTSIRPVIRVLAVQGLALGATAAVLGAHLYNVALLATAGVVVVIKVIVIPVLLSRVAPDGVAREMRPLVNVPSSLVIAAALVLVAYATTRGVAHFVGGTAGALTPVGFATLLVGFFVLVARRRPIFQIVGLLLVDNGIALVAFLVCAGVPFVIELGVSLDILLGVVVLTVLAVRMRTTFGDLDLDELQELHD